MLPSEKFELAVYRHVSALEPLPTNVSLPQISQIMGESDQRRAAERLIALEEDNRIWLTKWSGGSEFPRAQFRNDTDFFYNGSFLVRIAPQGRKYFEKLEQQAEQEEKPMSARKSPAVGASQLMSPKKALEILKPMIHNSAYLSGEPFGSPKREEWTHTAAGALARSFPPGSRIIESFGAAQCIALSSNSTDEELRRVAKDILAAQVAVLKSAIDQLGWELGEEEPLKVENKPMSSRDVFVIHGRDERLRAGMFDFLRSLDLSPMEWSRAVGLTGKSAPYVGEVLDAAFSNAQAVVVLLSPDDVARLRPELCGQAEPAHEVNLTYQARPNVLFESGMAMARHPDRTILVEIGALRPFSDVGGRHTIRMDNSPKKRQEIAQRLEKAGCPVNLSGTDWQTTGDMRPPEVSAIQQPMPSQPKPKTSLPNEPDHLLADVISELEDNLERARAPRVGDAYARPSLKVWKDNRNKLALPEYVRSEVTNMYREIDSWSTIVEAGINPNMGSVALENAAASLKIRLPELIAKLKKLSLQE
jgi:predicted nucleotide-binding protein